MSLDPATRYTLDFVLDALPKSAKRVLEIGCGAGALAAALRSKGIEMVALDMDAGAVEQARALGIDAQVAQWPHFSGGAFDAVLFTRSLHHLDSLAAGLDAAFAALRPGGRVIVEDFMAEGCTSRSDAWFRSFVRLLDRAALLPEPTPFLRSILGTGEPPERHHDLHASTTIEAALRARGGEVRATHSAYYFRYLLPASAHSPTLGAELLAHELALIAAGAIDPFGRRFVAVSPTG